MAEEFDPGESVPGVAKALEREGLTSEAAPVDNKPAYKVIADTKIPVSKELGKLWKARLEQSCAARRDTEDCWTEAINYYENNQMGNRVSNSQGSGTRIPRRLSERWTETENIVFSNATTMLPMLYAKNPKVECTAINEVNENYAKAADKLLDTLIGMKEAPGVKLKPKARRGILWCLLTNSAYIKVGYTRKEDANETAIVELNKLSQQYAEAKTRKEIQEIEGKLQALEEKISLLQPSGPRLNLKSPFCIYIDPTAKEPDHTDASWIVEEDYLPTSYLNAVYGEKKDGKIVSIYEPTHVLKAGGQRDSVGHDDEINSFSLLQLDDDGKKEASHYGYTDSKVYQKCQYTKVYWIWDKTTRRVFLFAENSWDWPVWVWNDPLKLLGFFPYSALHFYESVDKAQSIGEVTYYLDQQDAINDIHSTKAQARSWARRHIIFDKNAGIKQSDIEVLLKGPDGKAYGVDVPEGKKLGDVWTSVVPPSMQYPELLDPSTSYSVIDRMTGITAAQRGAEFRTNTTNQAINFYQKNADIKVDEKIDAIEDWIGDIAWKLLQIISVEFTTEQVIELIGETLGQYWVQLQSPEELRQRLAINIVGGSTDKPTSSNKKKAALEIGQILGQFSSASPVSLLIAARAIERAFADDVIIMPAEWDMLNKSIEVQLMPQQAPQPTQQTGGPDPAQVDALVQQLPREAQIQLKQMLDQGMPPEQALQQIQQQAQANQQVQPAA